MRNWEFLHSAASAAVGLGGDINPIKLLRRRSSLVVADLPVPLADRTKTNGVVAQAVPAVFEEPDSNSLLDSFGF